MNHHNIEFRSQINPKKQGHQSDDAQNFCIVMFLRIIKLALVVTCTNGSVLFLSDVEWPWPKPFSQGLSLSAMA